MASSSREIALLTNPTAGNGRGAHAAAVAVPRLTDAGFPVRELVGSDAEEAEMLARKAVAEGCAALVLCGGDGLVHVGVQAVAGTDTPMGIVPGGTGNDAARCLGLPLGDPAAAADRIIGSRRRRVDLARVGDRFFLSVLSAGFDALVTERANRMTWPRGRVRYHLATVAELRDFAPLTYTLDLDGAVRRVDAMLVAVGNGPSFGGGLRIAEGALIDDGMLDVVIIKPMSRPELVRTYPKLFRGTHVTHPQFEHHRVRRVTVAAPGVVTHADGERFGSLPLTVECVPAALEVIA